MATTTTKVSKSHPAIKTIIAATFPHYKGRTVKVVSGPSTVSGGPSDRASGTFRHARIVNLRTMGVVFVHDARFDLATSDDHLIVTHDFHCGRDCGITIHVGIGLPSEDVAVLVDALLQADGLMNRQIVGAMCHEMFASSLRPDLAMWGSYDRGHDRVTALDLAWVVVQEQTSSLRNGERRAAGEAAALRAGLGYGVVS